MTIGRRIRRERVSCAATVASGIVSLRWVARVCAARRDGVNDLGFAHVEDRGEPLGVERVPGELEVRKELAFVGAEVGDGLAVAVGTKIVDGKTPLAGKITQGKRHERVDRFHALDPELPGEPMPDETDLVRGQVEVVVPVGADASGGGGVLVGENELSLGSFFVEAQAERIDVRHVVADLATHAVFVVLVGRVPELKAPQVADARVGCDFVEFPTGVVVGEKLGELVVAAPEGVIGPLAEVADATHPRKLALNHFGCQLGRGEGARRGEDFLVAGDVPSPGERGHRGIGEELSAREFEGFLADVKRADVRSGRPQDLRNDLLDMLDGFIDRDDLVEAEKLAFPRLLFLAERAPIPAPADLVGRGIARRLIAAKASVVSHVDPAFCDVGIDVAEAVLGVLHSGESIPITSGNMTDQAVCGTNITKNFRLVNGQLFEE